MNSGSSHSKTNLPKYTTLHLTPPTVLDVFEEHLTFSDHIASPERVTITFVNLAVSSLTTIHQLPVPLLPLTVWSG